MMVITTTRISLIKIIPHLGVIITGRVTSHHHPSIRFQHGGCWPARVLLVMDEGAAYCFHTPLGTRLGHMYLWKYLQGTVL